MFAPIVLTCEWCALPPQDLASHVYVVIDGAVGVYIPEDVEEQTEYDTYLQKLRIVTLAGRVADNLRAQEAALDAAKASANIPSATSLASPTGKGDETKRVNLAFREELSPAVANVDVENDPTELDWDADVDVSRSPTAKGKGKLSGMTKKQKWLWAFKRILIGIRAGKFVETLLSRFKVHNGKRLVQVKLVRKGNPFGDLDLFHPSRCE